MITLEAQVSILRCRKCRRRTPLLTLSADTDMPTAGLVCLSSTSHNELAVVDDGSDAVREDLVPLRLLRTEAQFDGSGLRFQDFLKRYKPLRLVFACPACDGEASAIKTLSLDAFRRAGGAVTVFADVRLI